MNITLIIIGFFFFINPNVATLDILPDFIGIIFILAGMNRAADICDKLSKARRSLCILAYLNVLKMLTLATIPFLDRTNITWILTFTFVFSILETIIACTAFHQFFEGLAYIGMRLNCPAAYSESSPALATTIVVILKGALSLLPLFGFLSDGDEGIVRDVPIDPATLIIVFLAAGCLVSLVFGIVHFVMCAKYLRAISSDTNFFRQIEEQYEREVASNIPVITYKSLIKFMRYTCFASIFFVNFFVDAIDIIPDFLGAALMFFAAYNIKNLYKKEASRIQFTAVFIAVLSLASFVVSIVFNRIYTPTEGAFVLNAVDRVYSEVAASAFHNSLIAIDALRGAGIAALGIFIAAPILKIIGEHVGVPLSNANLESAKIRDMSKKLKMQRFCKAVMFLFILSGLFIFFARAFFFSFYDGANLSTISNVMPWLSLFISGAACVILWFFSTSVCDAVEYKYMF